MNNVDQHKTRVYIRESSPWAAIAARNMKAQSMAIVFGRTIHLHGTSKEAFLNNKKWLLHELKHVEQYQQYRFVPFLVHYFTEYLKNGYQDNRFEIAARAAETQDSLLDHYEII